LSTMRREMCFCERYMSCLQANLKVRLYVRLLTVGLYLLQWAAASFAVCVAAGCGTRRSRN
jgi:hypothetical protein